MKKTLTLLSACALSFMLGAFITSDDPQKPLTADMIAVASQVFGLEFTPAERDSMMDNLNRNRVSYETLRKIPLANDVAPALIFDPLPADFIMPTGANSLKQSSVAGTKLPADRAALAFYTVAQLGELIRTKQISSEELTKFFLDRL